VTTTDHQRATQAISDLSTALSDIKRLMPSAINRARTPGPQPDGYGSRHSDWTSSGGASELTTVEAAAQRALTTIATDPVRSTTRDVLRWLDAAARDARRMAQRLEQLGDGRAVQDSDDLWCRAHLDAGSREPRATGDECRACADFRRAFKRKPTPAEIDRQSRTGRWPRNVVVA
jgi:hypothetical protein